MQLSDDVQILPGHCEQSTIGRERASNEMVMQVIS
jgi:hypothetical protein